MKIGLSVKIDVTKIDKKRLYAGKKGTYLDLTTFINTDETNEYGDHGFISQSLDKEERDQGLQTPILGNVKVFYTDQAPQAPQAPQQAPQQDNFDDDIPF
jgi:hypothetical protein